MVTHLTKIGNSFGVILNKKLLQLAGVTSSKEVTIEVKDGTIVIAQASRDIPLNLDRSSWAKQFKKTAKAGLKPERSVWSDEVSEKADEDWTW
ncbi:MAG TPA: hypothetical protein VK563_13300 [Puia sp.]|nr:hypothetical protein [Puia sp.]